MSNTIATVVLRDNNMEHNTEVRVEVRHENGFLSIHPQGYGEHTAADGHGSPVLLEVWEGHLRVIVAPDINSEEQQITDLENARENNRKDTE